MAKKKKKPEEMDRFILVQKHSETHVLSKTFRKHLQILKNNHKKSWEENIQICAFTQYWIISLFLLTQSLFTLCLQDSLYYPEVG